MAILTGFPPSNTISPSVRISEVDLTLLSPTTTFHRIGLVGFASKGPINTPTSVTSLTDLATKFGNPHPDQGDPYLIYAAQQALQVSNDVVIVRVADVDPTSGSQATTASVEIPASGGLVDIIGSATGPYSFSADGNSQVAREFRRALSEIQMGSPVEKALGDVADRMQSEDLKWVVFAFSIQREVGGGLAKILQTSAETIDNRSSLRQEMRTLSTEGRISSYILMLLPPGIFLFLLATKREFISLFWVESIGQGLLVLVIMLMGLAWIWIRRLVNLAA
ncbi:MAG: hypothetical protein EBX77_03925 [Actinobacteria bacterium]|nr:hypothetical protein [Actinomycetota bacterium]